MEIEFLQRTIERNEWSIYFFITAWSIVAYNKYNFSVMFNDLSMVLLSDKYIKINEKKNNLTHWFSISMIAVQWFSLSFLVMIFLREYAVISHFDIRTYIQILNTITFFIICRYILEKITAITFDLEPLSEKINVLKLNYQNFLGLIYLSIATFLFYNPYVPREIYTALLIFLIILHAFVYYNVIKWNQKIIKTYFIYFILYLCTFEIVPYLFLYKWFKFLEI